MIQSQACCGDPESMRTALSLGALALAVVGSWWALDDMAEDVVREQIQLNGLEQQLSFSALELDLPRGVTLLDIALRDGTDGHDVVQLARLDIDLALGWDEGFTAELMGIDGRGGRIAIVPTADTLGSMVASLIDVIATIVGLVDEAREAGGGADSSDLPPLWFHDLDVVLLADSWPVENYPGSQVLVAQNGPTIDATIDFGGGGGRLVLVFGNGGLERLVTEDLLLTPGIVRLIGEPWGPLLARLTRPQGRADLLITALHQDLPDIHGVIREAVIDSPLIPVPLGPLTLPLDLTDGILSVTTEPWPFNDGTMVATIEGTADALDLAITIRDGGFSEALLGLVPVYGEQDVVRCRDGGQFDLDLELSWDFALGSIPAVTGQGGFHVQAIDLEGLGLTLEDVVGRLEVSGEQLVVPEVTGLLAEGGFTGSGELDLADNRFRLDLSLKELNLAELQSSLAPEVARESPLEGWVAGRVLCSGDMDSLDQVQGQGEVTIRAGRFAESRMLTLIRQALTLGPAERRNDQRLVAELNLWDGILTINQVSVDLGLLALTGQGRVDRDGVLDLYLLLMSEPEGVLGSLWGFIQRNLICEVQVTGPFERLDVAVFPVGVISKPLQAAIDFLSVWRDEDP